MRFVAIGDSFTEGVGDEPPRGAGGWADRAAIALASIARESVSYANLAIRGRLLGPVLEQQLPAALALDPSLISICAGGNNLLRPVLRLDVLLESLDRAVTRCLDSGASVVLLSPPDPSARLPLGGLIYARGHALAEVIGQVASAHDVPYVDVSHDRELRRAAYWSDDRLHLNPNGHRRVASLFLAALGGRGEPFALPEAAEPARTSGSEFRYMRKHVMPWIGRRLRGRSSGDARVARIAEWSRVEPAIEADDGPQGVGDRT